MLSASLVFKERHRNGEALSLDLAALAIADRSIAIYEFENHSTNKPPWLGEVPFNNQWNARCSSAIGLT